MSQNVKTVLIVVIIAIYLTVAAGSLIEKIADVTTGSELAIKQMENSDVAYAQLEIYQRFQWAWNYIGFVIATTLVFLVVKSTSKKTDNRYYE